jgi:hypothetical protein
LEEKNYEMETELEGDNEELGGGRKGFGDR